MTAGNVVQVSEIIFLLANMSGGLQVSVPTILYI